MNNIDLILDSIKKDANKEVSEILSRAKEEGKKLIEDRENEAKIEAENIIKNAEKEADLLIENSKITANREARDIKIRAENDLVSNVLSKLKEKLKTISPDDYKKFVINSIDKMKVENAEILLEKDKKELFSQEELKGLKISDQTVDEGFVVRSGKIEYDSKFSSLVEYNKDKFEREVVEKIFK